MSEKKLSVSLTQEEAQLIEDLMRAYSFPLPAGTCIHRKIEQARAEAEKSRPLTDGIWFLAFVFVALTLLLLLSPEQAFQALEW